MTTRIRFFGFAAFEIVTAGGIRIIVDPYLDDSEVSPVKSDDLDKVDLVLVTHGAWDHIGDAGKISRKHNAPVVCGPEVKAALVSQGVAPEMVLSCAWGLEIDFRGVRVRPVESHHTSWTKLAGGSWATGFPMGFIVYVDEDTRIYHMGDTAIFSDLRLIGELYRPNIALVHVALPDVARAGDARVVTGEMTPYESALACQWLGVRYAIPCHFSNPDDPDIRAFEEVVAGMTVGGRRPFETVVLKPGEAWEYGPEA